VTIVTGLFYAILAIIVGSAIVAVGGGGIQTMRRYWERAAAPPPTPCSSSLRDAPALHFIRRYRQLLRLLVDDALGCLGIRVHADLAGLDQGVGGGVAAPTARCPEGTAAWRLT